MTKLKAGTIGEELLGMEIVAGKELAESVGTLYDTAQRTQQLWLQQARWLLADYAQFCTAALGRPLQIGPMLELIERRSGHIADGMHAAAELIQEEYTPLSKPWSDFAQVVADDWRSSSLTRSGDE